MAEKESKKELLEAALFTASNPLSLNQLASIAGSTKKDTRKLLRELKSDLASGLELIKLGSRYELRPKARYADKVSKLTPYKDIRRGALKALALIAFADKDLVTQSDLVKTIGNRAYEYVRELEEKGLIKARKWKRTKALQITKGFLNYFGIESKEELEKFRKETNE